MKASVKWVDGMMFLGETGSGHAVVMDGAPEAGGRNHGIRPLVLLLLGRGGRTSFDVVLMLERGCELVNGCQVEITAERADSDPKVFTKIHLDYRLSGKGLAPAKVERAIALSKEKYCSASIMLGATADITTAYSVSEERELAP